MKKSFSLQSYKLYVILHIAYFLSIIFQSNVRSCFDDLPEDIVVRITFFLVDLHKNRNKLENAVNSVKVLYQLNRNFDTILNLKDNSRNVIKIISKTFNAQEIEVASLLGTRSAIQELKTLLPNTNVKKLNKVFWNFTQKSNISDTSSIGIKSLLKTEMINTNVEHNCYKSPLIVAIQNGSIGLVKELIDYELTNVNTVDYGELPALSASIMLTSFDKSIYEKISELLINHKDIDVNARSFYGCTPLMEAFTRQAIKIVKMLLNHPNIDVNAQDPRGRTALFLVVNTGNKHWVKLLLDHPKTDINLPTKFGITPLQQAKRKNHKDIIKLLEKKEAK